MKVTTQLDKISNNFINQYLTSLGISDIKHYIKPIKKNFESPWDYPNMMQAVEALNYYILKQTNIGIVVDSDADGSCSAALIYLFLLSQGVNKDKIQLYFHTGKQHGLNDVLNQILENNKDNNDSLLIVPDAGTNDINECKILCENFIETIICDHHNIETDNIFAIIINNQYKEVSNKHLSGTGVIDKLIKAYCEFKKIKCPDYNDLVAVSIGADVCNLIPIENRTYMYYGLHNIKNNFLRYLFEKCCGRNGYTPKAIGWDIAPLCNALARSSEQSTKLIFFKGLIGEIEPEEALRQMKRIKRMQDEDVKLAVSEIEFNVDINQKVIIGLTDSINANYTGLIANKFAGKYNKPSIILREDIHNNSFTGSLRSPVQLATMINNSQLGEAHGHENACGVIIEKDKLQQFINWTQTLDLTTEVIIPVVAQIKPKNINLKLCGDIDKYKELWATNVDNPTFYTEFEIEQDNIFIFKKSTTTIKISKDGISFLKFFANEKDVDSFTKYKQFKIELVISELSINDYNNIKTPQCIIQEYEITPINKSKINSTENWLETF